MPKPKSELLVQWIIQNPYQSTKWAQEAARYVGTTARSVQSLRRRMVKAGQVLDSVRPHDVVPSRCPDCGESRYPGGRVRESRCEDCARRIRNRKSMAFARERRATRAKLPFESFEPEEVFARDEYTCHWCGVRDVPLTLDHLIPIKSRNTPPERNPGHVLRNVVASCRPCNSRRNNREDAWSDVFVLTCWYEEAIGVPSLARSA